MLSEDDRQFVFHHAAAYVYNYNPDRFDEAIEYAHWYMDKYGDRKMEDLPFHSTAWRAFIKRNSSA